MIFICTGTQIYQFNRLLSKIDDLIEEGVITDEVFAQTGASTYIPKNYQYKAFLSHEEFARCQFKATLIISHGGTGALIGASKKGKNIIAVPRLSRFGEHVDDHQMQIVEVLSHEGYLRGVYDIETLGLIIREALLNPISNPYTKEFYILDIIRSFIVGA